VAILPVQPNERGTTGERRWIDCDAVGMSSGWNPTVHLYSQAGGKVRYEPQFACLVPDGCPQRVRIVGAANAEFGVGDAIASAARAGREAALASRLDQALTRLVTEHRKETLGHHFHRRVLDPEHSRQWVDFQHDVTTADIALAVRENYVSVEHLKRYTTNGMSVDQGKTSNLNALTLLAQLTGRQVAQVGTTTFRPQFLPVTLGAINGGAKGDLYAPERHMPMHAWHVDHGAQMEEYGGWRRPACYIRQGERHEQAIVREVRQVRERLGLFESSPLGKIEVRGPGAAQFLDRIYLNNVMSLAPGRVRYGLMLNENGIVFDDGVFARLSPEHFLISTTAANAERIAAWLDEWHQCEWPQFELIIQPVTSQWAVLTLAGAAARRLLQVLPTDLDFSPDAFPHMSVRAGHLAGCHVRVQRVSFTGELSYEIAVSADGGIALWEELMQRGREFDIGAIGIEALLVLRLEKGFLHVGADTDGTTNPLDLGMGAIVAKKSGDFIGRRSLLRALDQRDDRRQLIGLEAGRRALVSGANLVAGRDAKNRRSEGFVTSAAWSPTLERSIGLALLERGVARVGDTVTAFDAGRLVEARVVRPPFFDSRGVRMNA
jgi:sarcosine oxidase subunit alpha